MLKKKSRLKVPKTTRAKEIRQRIRAKKPRVIHKEPIEFERKIKAKEPES